MSFPSEGILSVSDGKKLIRWKETYEMLQLQKGKIFRESVSLSKLRDCGLL